MSARALWKGVIEFEMVTVPVKLYTAVRPQTIHFRMLHDQDNVPVRQVLECPVEHEEVPREHVVKGYEIHPGKYVLLQEEDLEKAAPVPSRAIKVLDFVHPAEIDPIYFEKAYWLGPDAHAEKAFGLLHRALKETKRSAIVEFVMRGTEYLAAIRAADDGVLCLQTMRYNDEVVPVSEVIEGTSKTKLNDRELKTAEQLIAALSADFDPSQYKDEFRNCVMKMIQEKAEGKEPKARSSGERASTRGPDLLEALKASIAKTKERHPRSRSKRKSA